MPSTSTGSRPSPITAFMTDWICASCLGDGQGYDVESLSNLFTGNDAWARLVVKEVGRRVDDPARMRALGFCVSVDHARFMARIFRDAGISATAIWSDTPDHERHRALKDLADRRVNVVFSVDLFNEGVDVPAVDTLLMLRPTESPTLFLQQLGRGLRRHPAKTACIVLDFIGHHRARVSIRSTSSCPARGCEQEVAAQVEQGFPFLPAGCHMELDRVARDIVLASIRGAVPSRWSAKVEELRSLAKGATAFPLAAFLEKKRARARGYLHGRQELVGPVRGGGSPGTPGRATRRISQACLRSLFFTSTTSLDRCLPAPAATRRCSRSAGGFCIRPTAPPHDRRRHRRQGRVQVCVA